MDLYNTLNKKLEELTTSVKSLRITATEYAEAYRNYRILLAKKLTQLKADGMAITLASDIARGDEEIANAKMVEIKKEAIYKANMESINAIKLEIKIIENQITREVGL